jgi:hypothetical protein
VIELSHAVSLCSRSTYLEQKQSYYFTSAHITLIENTYIGIVVGKVHVLKKLFLLIHLHHRLSIHRPTKLGKEKSPSDGKCEKEMDDHLLAYQ